VSFEAKRVRIEIPCNRPPSVFPDGPGPHDPDQRDPLRGDPWELCRSHTHNHFKTCYLVPELDERALERLLEDLIARGTEAEGAPERDTTDS